MSEMQRTCNCGGDGGHLMSCPDFAADLARLRARCERLANAARHARGLLALYAPGYYTPDKCDSCAALRDLDKEAP